MKPTYEELEAKCAALAAENAGLKAEAKETLAHWAAAEPGEMEKMMDKCMPALRIAYCETPATDAFLAEVRAQGVEQLATLAGNECQRYKSVNDRAGARKWKSIVILCTDFSAQLRKGVQS